MKNLDQLCAEWLAEEEIAHIHGWDFSHIEGRYSEADDLPWDYRDMICKYLRPEMKLLDMDTGGGEFLLSLKHPHENTACTEAYPPNVEFCKQLLLPLGIDFRVADAGGTLPWPDETFAMIINRHGDFNAREIRRILKPGGLFITQQVGASNDRELVRLLLPQIEEVPFPEQWLSIASEKFAREGFEICRGEEFFGSIRFYDVGALVWFARVIPWEFTGFDVKECLPQLMKAQQIIEETGCVEATIHRFMFIAKKK